MIKVRATVKESQVNSEGDYRITFKGLGTSIKGRVFVFNVTESDDVLLAIDSMLEIREYESLEIKIID